MTTGFVLSLEEDADEMAEINFHRNLGIAMTFFLALAAGVRWKARGPRGRIAYLVLLAVASMLLIGAAHMGATLVHGEGYLLGD